MIKRPPQGTRKTCKNGHVFYKRSDCPSCPKCESDSAPKNGFLAALSAPARRALEREGINTLEKLARRSESELLRSHGFGRASLPQLRKALKDSGLAFAAPTKPAAKSMPAKKAAARTRSRSTSSGSAP